MRDATRAALSRIPTPMLLLVAGAVAAQVGLRHSLSHHVVMHIVNVALVVILLDGGMHLGLARVREAAAPILLAGLPGTFLTALGAALVAHMGFGWSWWVSLLVGTAVAPTDPAVVFSILGGQEIEGRTDTILEGESGANDPVGIALMAGLLSAGGVSGGALGHVAREFLLEMLVGAAVGIVVGWLLRQLRGADLPGGRASQLLPVLAAAFGAYELAVVLHGSGFLAVFLAGILIGGLENPYQQAIERFHGAVAGLGEVVAFIVLGLTVDLRLLGRTDVFVPGLVLAVLLAVVIRPAAVGLCLSGVELARGERGFVLWAGLKGAVPLLLGSSLLTATVPHPPRLYGVVVVVVAFSVLVQGGLLPYAARRLGLELRAAEPGG